MCAACTTQRLSLSTLSYTSCRSPLSRPQNAATRARAQSPPRRSLRLRFWRRRQIRPHLSLACFASSLQPFVQRTCPPRAGLQTRRGSCRCARILADRSHRRPSCPSLTFPAATACRRCSCRALGRASLPCCLAAIPAHRQPPRPRPRLCAGRRMSVLVSLSSPGTLTPTLGSHPALVQSHAARICLRLQAPQLRGQRGSVLAVAWCASAQLSAPPRPPPPRR
mmetsp:Transcript_22124/g.73402  ORF Transcript_22124/g.73402 Transcript_22124/m.73402 type:complete len:223 (+) Transcript_22124:110-778(+)